jgi:hypothetical protein
MRSDERPTAGEDPGSVEAPAPAGSEHPRLSAFEGDDAGIQASVR